MTELFSWVDVQALRLWLESEVLPHLVSISMILGVALVELIPAVRSLIKAKAAFAKYLDDVSLDADQIYFVNQIIEYIVHNGVMRDMTVLQEAPFTDRGSVAEVFSDVSVWLGIKRIIEEINANAAA